MYSTSTRKQILVIDPDASLAKRLIDDTCGNLVEVATAYNSLAGLTLATETMPDLILMGSMLSGINCFEVLQKLRSFNAMLIQIFAFLNNAVLFAEIEERRTKTIFETMEISSLEEIQEAGEDLAAKLGQVLETKTIVKGIKARLEDLLG